MSMGSGSVFTIGHGNHSQQIFREQLRHAGVSYVVDVRSAPYSRFQPDFSREPLAHFLKEDRIGYVFMGDLLGGRPADESCYIDGRVDYAIVRSKEFFVQGISRLKKAYGKGFSICLLCSEGHPSHCHRSKLVAEALVDDGIEVSHIMPDGSHRSQAEVIADLTDGQFSLFAEHFKSRKVYR